MSVPYDCKKINYEQESSTSNEYKDQLKIEIKSQMTNLDLSEKNLSKIITKLKSLENEFSLLNQEKLRMEHESKAKSKSINKQLQEIQIESEKIQNSLNQKLSLNKKLNFDFLNLLTTMENKASNLNQLRAELNNVMESNSYLLEEKSELGEELKILKEKKYKNKIILDKLLDENQMTEKLCKDEEILIHQLESDKNQFTKLNDELRYENSNLNNKIRIRDENINSNQKQLEESNSRIFKMNHSLRELESNAERLKMDFEYKISSNQKEIRIKSQKENEIVELENFIKENERKIKFAMSELEILKCEKEKLFEVNSKILSEIDIVKNHIFEMTDANTNLSEMLDNLLEKDLIVQNNLKRHERTKEKLKNHRNILDKNFDGLDLDNIRSSEIKSINTNIDVNSDLHRRKYNLQTSKEKYSDYNY